MFDSQICPLSAPLPCAGSCHRCFRASGLTSKCSIRPLSRTCIANATCSTLQSTPRFAPPALAAASISRGSTSAGVRARAALPPLQPHRTWRPPPLAAALRLAPLQPVPVHRATPASTTREADCLRRRRPLLLRPSLCRRRDGRRHPRKTWRA